MLYTVRIEYFATGEGLSIWWGVTTAKDKESAGLFLRDTFFPTQSQSWQYFSQGLEVEEGVKREWLKTLNPDYLDWIENKGSKCYLSLSGYTHFNCS